MSDAKVKYLIWDSIKRAFKRHPLVDSVRWWFSRRKIKSYQRQLVSRRSFFGTPLLLLVPYLPAPRTPQELRELIIGEYIKTAAGKAKLAQAMILPIRQRLNYAKLSRQVFTVDQLPGRDV